MSMRGGQRFEGALSLAIVRSDVEIVGMNRDRVISVNKSRENE